MILLAMLVAAATCAMAAASGPSPEDTLERLERQREERAPEIAKLKALGIAGENRDGRLEILDAVVDASEVIDTGLGGLVGLFPAVGDWNGDGDIGWAWGLWAGPGGEANAAWDLAGPLGVGQVLKRHMRNFRIPRPTSR